MSLQASCPPPPPPPSSVYPVDSRRKGYQSSEMSSYIVTGVCEKNAHCLDDLTGIMPPAPPSSMLGVMPRGDSRPAKKTPISRTPKTHLEASTLKFGVRGDGLTCNAAHQMGVFFADTGIRAMVSCEKFGVRGDIPPHSPDGERGRRHTGEVGQPA